ncbi:J domain-containing protein [Synechococcus sp. PCC 6312]|uniref:J domain-containing protein n=1 Tax=Synechococcus sp. (strain ATCC 27167 / PCC 6312) TaxID=195253 RepID=UPI00029F41DC|nr:J domain-containing protein [Synechococcus sp. PCC 6312]AFY61624.1 DnaJ-class molecular chaperone with C-terminal Zn finger domain [Synechococcus sp. PCC 6312]
MSFEINRGLGKFNSAKDYHAALGLPLGADAAQIRKQYLKIARNLHPDSRSNDESQQLASQILSKLVNPAYQLLTQEKQREEYEVILRLLGQQLVNGQIPLNQSNPAVTAIMTAPDYEATYLLSLETLANQQYENLTASVAITGQISELNLALLWRQHGGSTGSTAVPQPTVTSATPPTPTMPASSPPPTAVSSSKSTQSGTDQYTEQYYRRAEEFFRKNSFQQAIKELRDALKLNPNSSRCHALMGQTYLKQGQITMAKVHFNQALKINPQEGQAVTGMETITKAERRAQQKSKQTIPPKPSSGGLFGSLFKKKDK